VPLVYRDPNATRVAKALRRLADLIESLKGAKPAAGYEPSLHAELKQIAVRLERIGETLEAGKKAGRTTSAQLRSVARNFEGIAEALEKGAGGAGRGR
jgi:hypothetical protein